MRLVEIRTAANVPRLSYALETGKEAGGIMNWDQIEGEWKRFAGFERERESHAATRL